MKVEGRRVAAGRGDRRRGRRRGGPPAAAAVAATGEGRAGNRPAAARPQVAVGRMAVADAEARLSRKRPRCRASRATGAQAEPVAGSALGVGPLGTFGELAAFWERRRKGRAARRARRRHRPTTAGRGARRRRKTPTGGPADLSRWRSLARTLSRKRLVRFPPAATAPTDRIDPLPEAHLAIDRHHRHAVAVRFHQRRVPRPRPRAVKLKP